MVTSIAGMGGREIRLLESRFAILNNSDRNRRECMDGAGITFVVSNGRPLIQRYDADQPRRGEAYARARSGCAHRRNRQTNSEIFLNN